MANIIIPFRGNLTKKCSKANYIPSTKSLSFDGTDDYVDCDLMTGLDLVPAFTISLWLKFDNLSGVQRIAGQRFGGNNIISLATVGDEVYPSIDGAYGATIGANLIASTWYHMTMVFDGNLIGNENRLKLYIDGVQESLLPFVGTIPATTKANPTPFYLGDDGFFQDYYGGLIDEVCILNRAATPAEITTLSTAPTVDLSSLNPIAWYRNGDGDTYPTIRNVSCLGINDGAMTNMSALDIVTDVP